MLLLLARYALGYVAGFILGRFLWFDPKSPALGNSFYVFMVWLPETVLAYFLIRWCTAKLYSDPKKGPFLIVGSFVGLMPLFGPWPVYFFLNVTGLLTAAVRYALAGLILVLHCLITEKLPVARRRRTRPSA
jgi:hypothetical protein